MESHSNVFVQTYEQGITRVLQGNYAFLIESPMLDYAVQRDCNLTQIGEFFFVENKIISFLFLDCVNTRQILGVINS